MSLGNQEPGAVAGPERKASYKGQLTPEPTGQFRLNFRQAMVLAAVPVTATSGNTLLAIGMRQIGPIGARNWELLFSALINPYVLAGIILLIGFFSSYLLALSWADLTYVIPTTSFGYILIPLVSHFYLKESISDYRWLGVVLIFFGVLVGAQGPIRTGPGLSQEESK